MDAPKATISACLERLPSPAEIRRELSKNVREKNLLRQLLKISEQREKVREVTP